VHHASFIAFGLTLLHALYAGTDFVGARGVVIVRVALAPVLWLGFLRILEPCRSRVPDKPRRALAIRSA
jgi:hypothetical protein